MTPTTAASTPRETVAGVGREHAGEAIGHLYGRLVSLIDLELTLKHVHWNVVGADFVSVHEMLDRFTAAARTMTDAVAERIRVLGGVPRGRPGDVVAARHWDDYPLDEASSAAHLAALDTAYEGIILDHRRAIAHVATLDPVTEDLLIGQTGELEKHQWFIRSFSGGVGEPTRAPVNGSR